MSTTGSSYLVCATQRSGSTLLVESLRATSVAGHPAEFFQYLPHSSLSPRPREWFEGVDDAAVLSLLPPLDPGRPDTRTSDQWAKEIAADGRTSNGVWGGKLMWNQVENVLDRASKLSNRSGRDLSSAIIDIIGVEPVFIHVRRPDVVPQAVSMWRAVQTEVWRGSTPVELDARAQYNADGIAHLAQILLGQEASWSKWFASESINPIDVEFSALTADPQAQTARILDALGLDPSLAPAPPLKKQSNARSSDWVDRYRADAEKRGLPR